MDSDTTNRQAFKLESMGFLSAIGLLAFFIIGVVVCIIVGAKGPQVYIVFRTDEFGLDWENPPAQPLNISVPWIDNGQPLSRTKWITHAFNANNDRMVEGLWFEIIFMRPAVDLPLTNIPILISSTGSVQQGGVEDKLVEPLLQLYPFLCSKGAKECRPTTLLHFDAIDYKSYAAQVAFVNATRRELSWLDGFATQWTQLNPNFAKFELGFRYIFVFLSILGFVLYWVKLSKYPRKEWQTEQKAMLLLLFLMVLYNNPIYILSVLVKYWLFPFLNSLFIITYLGCLMLFLLIQSHCLLVPRAQRTFVLFYLPKLILVGAIYVMVLVTFTIEAVKRNNTPAYGGYTSAAYFVIFWWTGIVLLIVYIFWLGFLFFRGIGNRGAIQHFRLRFAFIWTVTLVVIASAVIALIIRALHVFESAAEFLAFFGLFNFYTWTVAFCFLPSDVTLEEAKRNEGANPGPKTNGQEFVDIEMECGMEDED